MATNKYIGARYVPIIDGEWDKTKMYEPLTVVLHSGNSYTSKCFVPAGADILDQQFWSLTGNYNAQVEQYREEVVSLGEQIVEYGKNTTAWYNALHYGVKNDGSTDNAVALQALFTLAKGGTVYLPSGTYYTSKTIFIPTMTQLIGDGYQSYLWLSTDDTTPGTTIATAGNDITISNIRIGYKGDNDTPKLGEQNASVGVSTYVYNSAIVGDYTTRASCFNINITNLHCTGIASVQIEPDTNNNISGINISDVYASISLFAVSPSSTPTTTGGKVGDCNINNVNCGFFRVGYNAHGSFGINCSNIFSNFLRVAEDNVNLTNITTDNSLTSPWHSLDVNYCWFLLGDKIIVSNVNIIGKNSDIHVHGIEISQLTNSQLSNVICTGFSDFNLHSDPSEVKYINCNFSGSNNTIAGQGFNVSGTFPPISVYIDPQFQNSHVIQLPSRFVSETIVLPRLYRGGQVCIIEMSCRISTGTLQNNDIIGNLSNDMYIPTNTEQFYGYAWKFNNATPSPTYPVCFSIQPTTKTVTVYSTYGANLDVDRFAFQGTYLIK